MKTKHNYNDELETFLMFMSDDEYFEWLKTNEIEYETTLLDLILKDKLEMENKE